jgi:hypothetical protein
MKVKMNQLTYHAKEERRDRREIVKQVGIGRPIAQVKKFSDNGREKTEMLTDTGLIVVMGDDNKIITLYLASTAKAAAVYKSAHGANAMMPVQIFEQIKINRIMFPAD